MRYMSTTNETLVEIKHLKKYFNMGRKGDLKAVDDLSFSISRGETVGMVGESGCGKTTAGRSILRLYEPTAGEVLFEGENILKISNTKMKNLRRDMQ